MRIGYCVEGSLDRAVLEGLRRRWCPRAEMIEGQFRGQFRRREMRGVCLELASKGVDLIVLMRDANLEAWRDVSRADRDACPLELQVQIVVGVCNRNVECWLAADSQYLAKVVGATPQDFGVPDPKNVVTRAFGITALDRREDEIANVVRQAPLHRWLANHSFEAFYEQLRDQSQRLGCSIENLRERADQPA